MSGEQRRDYIYNGLYAGALRDGESEEDAKAYADENISSRRVSHSVLVWSVFLAD